MIHTPGKVGSSSVFRTLKNDTNLFAEREIYHTHDLNLTNLEALKKSLKGKGVSTGGHIEDSYSVLKLIGRRAIDYITLTRSPIERNISAYFENHKFLTSYKFEELSVDGHIDQFKKKYVHNLILTWFDNNVKRPIGIDVYQSEFPFDSSYQTYEYEGARLLVLKCELPDATKQRVIEEYLGVNGLEWKNENIGEKKQYAAIYKEFKSRIKLSEQYVDEMTSSKYCRHFYSQEEIDLMKKRWKRVRD